MGKTALILFSSLVIILIITFFVFIFLNNQPISQDNTIKIFSVKSGEGVQQIATRLEENNFIKNKYVFLYYCYRLSLNQKIQAGNFKISPNLTTKEIVIKLSQEGVTDYWLKIIEGNRIEEISSLFPPNTSFIGKEGYLFPDSYLIPQYYNFQQIFEIIQSNFDKKFAQAKIDATNTRLNDQEVLIFASILEREARTLKSKQEIAGILLNRLKINMALQVDATVQYARDSQNKSVTKYWQPLNKADLQINSSFNTYKNQGLPPRPICNPGYNSLYAAFHPMKSDYFYYITGNDGKMYYATTLDEHNSNIAKYLK